MRIGIIGMGLIGGSFEKASRAVGYDVKGWGRRAPFPAPLPGELSDRDLLIVCLPPSTVADWITEHQSEFKRGAVVIDACGVKRTVCDALRRFAVNCEWEFVGAHPMAGREVGGYVNSKADLFQGASMVFTPYPSSGRITLDKLEAYCKSIGFAKVVFTTPEHHDTMIALTSQLAHVVSYAYAASPLAKEHMGFSAGSFADMTRVAASDPAMWTDLFLANRDKLSEVLDGLVARLTGFSAAIKAGDAETLRRLADEGNLAKLSLSGCH